MKKKFLSMLTTLVMTVSLCGILPSVTANAGGGLGHTDPIALNETKTIKFSGDGSEYFEFIPTETTMYCFSTSISSGTSDDSLYINGRIYNDVLDEMYCHEESTSNIYLYKTIMQAGKKYYVGCEHYDYPAGSDDVSVDVTVYKDGEFSPVVLNTGNTNITREVGSDGRMYLSFTAPKSGYYSIKEVNYAISELDILDSSYEIRNEVDFSYIYPYRAVKYFDSGETIYYDIWIDGNFDTADVEIHSSIKEVTDDYYAVQNSEFAEYTGKEYYGMFIAWAKENNGVLNIPDKISGDKVVGIYYSAFEDNDYTQINIPSTVKYISASAFERSYNLKKIDIPNGVEYIGNWAFGSCNKLENVTIGKGVFGIDSRAFYNCCNLKTITIPSSVKYIGEYAIGFTWDEETGNEVIVPGIKIVGKKGSAAEKYAKENGFVFEDMESKATKPAPKTKPTTNPTPKKITSTKVIKPAKVTKLKLTAKKKKLNVTWKKVSGAKGYQVMSATNKKFTKNKKTVNVNKNKVTLKKLKSKKKYFVKVRAYKTVNGKKVYGKWSKAISKKVK